MAVNYFLKLDGVEGESADAQYKKQIQILGWSWGASQLSSVGANGGSGAGKVDLADLNISTHFDKATPKLFRNICAGTHFNTATLTACKVGGVAPSKPYLTVDMQELFVTSIRLNAQTELPSVDLSFTYNKITIEYFQQNGSGDLTSTGEVSYDLTANKLEK